MESIERIRKTLASLRERDKECLLFGSDRHRYAMEAPWGEPELLAFEAEHDVTLPADYRAFLSAIGVSGAGPGYGLSAPAPLSLDAFPRVVSRITGKDGTVLAESGTPKRPSFARTSRVDEPFPLHEGFEPSFIYDLPALSEHQTPYDGAIEIAEHGCGYFDFLVVTGPGAGQVWSDTMAAMRNGAMLPKGLTFLEWYEAWLNGCHRELDH